MRKLGVRVLAVLSFASLSAFAGEEVVSLETGLSSSTNQVAAADLWAGMHEQGMINDEQYRHVQENGCLPGGTTLTNSPVAAEAQADWNKLAREGVVTPDELAAKIFDGDIPGLTEKEERAFIELAPVYRSKRSKRLTYEVRRKHMQVELIRLGHRLRAERKAMEQRAKLLDIPLHRAKGVLMDIDEGGVPYYSESSGMGGSDTISTDEVWGTNAVNAAGETNTNLNLFGSGITLATFEWGGVRQDHVEFGGRVEDHGPQDSEHLTWHPLWNDKFDHANAVSAILVGAGLTNTAHGMAPAAELEVFCRRSDMFSKLRGVVQAEYIRFSNHSYELYRTYGQYYGSEWNCDDVVYDGYWHLPVWAAGNFGSDGEFDTLAGGIAKNVLCVGAIKESPSGFSGASNVELIPISGCGPADDGRIKPDLVAGGYTGGIIPATNSATKYIVYEDNATSFAAPAVTGSLGLLQELHERLSGTNAVPLLASTYKAIAIHTADEAGEAPGPDYRFGWGVMNTYAAAELLVENANWNNKPFIKEITIASGDHASYIVETDASSPLKATICWSDPPGGTLVNDLDLRVIDESGTTNFPWVLNPNFDANFDHRSDPASQDDNTRDNVEQVVVTNVVAGVYTVIISHKDVLVNDKNVVDGQEVSIILSGIDPDPVDPSVVFSITTNGQACLSITDYVGSVYEVLRVDKLSYPWWEGAEEFPISIHQMPSEWIDPASSTNDTSFYRVQRTE